jgi:hypothetical protein
MDKVKEMRELIFTTMTPMEVVLLMNSIIDGLMIARMIDEGAIEVTDVNPNTPLPCELMAVEDEGGIGDED